MNWLVRWVYSDPDLCRAMILIGEAAVMTDPTRLVLMWFMCGG